MKSMSSTLVSPTKSLVSGCRTRARLQRLDHCQFDGMIQRSTCAIGCPEAALDRDNFMSPSEAKEFGLIDHIVEKREVPEADG